MQPFTILLIEDDEVDVIAIERAFQTAKITNPLVVANNGEEALNLIHKKVFPPFVTLLDLNLPKISGIEFLKHIRNNPRLKKMIIIVLTSSDSDKDICKAYEHQVAGYITKPINSSELANKLSSFNTYWGNCELWNTW
jgi:CheY-like chemotaxis protein